MREKLARFTRETGNEKLCVMVTPITKRMINYLVEKGLYDTMSSFVRESVRMNILVNMGLIEKLVENPLFNADIELNDIEKKIINYI